MLALFPLLALGAAALASLVPDQAVLAMPLALGLVPDADVPAVRKALARRIRERDGGRIDTGIYGTRYLGDALMDGGEADLWLRMLKGPGWIWPQENSLIFSVFQPQYSLIFSWF